MPTAKRSTSTPDSNSFQKRDCCDQKSVDTARPVATYGELFPSGATIDLLQPPETGSQQLHFFDGKDTAIGSQVEFDGRLFRPARLSDSMKRIVRFPEKSVDFVCTTQLFEETLQLFSGSGFGATIARAATYFVFATWFAEVLPFAPFVFVTGPRFEAASLFRLLSFVVRHPLPISEFNRRALISLPMQMNLTFLITLLELRRSSLELLRISNRNPALLSVKDELVDVFCAKAVYCEDTENNPLNDEIGLHIHLTPSGVVLANNDRQESAAQNLQSKFLAYRCRNIMRVQQSQFDLPNLTSKTRILGRVLGAPLVDAPALGVELARILENREESERLNRWTDLRCVVLEAVIHHLHKEPDSRIHVGEITQTAMAILRGRGDFREHDPREIGNVLRTLGIYSKRHAGGYAIALDSALNHDMHRLAHELGLLQGRKVKDRCALCTEISISCKA